MQDIDAPRDLSAAEALLGRMKASGVDLLFANGGTDFPSIIEALARSSESGIAMPEAVVIPHEAVAVSMAHGYYLMTGKPAAVMVHVNVGLANAVMGLLNAASERVPILMCSGRTPITESGRLGSRSVPIHWGQEMRDQGAMVREAVKWDYELRYPEQAGAAVDRALGVAMSVPRGPVYLSLPREVLAEAAPGADPVGPAFAPTRPGSARPEAVAEAAAILSAAERPVLISQSPDPHADLAALSALAERCALPVVEFFSPTQSLPTSHPMHVGRDPAPWVREADAVVVLSALAPWIADSVTLPEGCKVIALGDDPLHPATPMRGFPVDVSLSGDPGETLTALALAVDPDESVVAARRARVETARRAQATATEKRIAAGAHTPMSPAWVSKCLSDAADESTVFFNELGVDPAAMEFPARGMLFGTPLAGGLGWGLPAALGAKLADRSRQVIACVGDGSYMFANPVACHQTAAALGLPLLTVVFNNGIWNAVRRATLHMYPDGTAASANVMPVTALTPAPDYAAVARAHGAHAERVEDGQELPAAISRALAATRAGQQALLEVMVTY